jgi:hypothetical protein
LYFFERLRYAVLPDNGDVLLALRLFYGAQGTQGACVVSGSNENALVPGMPLKKFRGDSVALVGQSSGIHSHEAFSGNVRQAFSNAFECASDATLH